MVDNEETYRTLDAGINWEMGKHITLFVLILLLIMICFVVRRVILLLKAASDEDARQDNIVIIRNLLALPTLISGTIPSLSVLFRFPKDWIYIITGINIFIIITMLILWVVIERIYSQLQNKEK